MDLVNLKQTYFCLLSDMNENAESWFKEKLSEGEVLDQDYKAFISREEPSKYGKTGRDC
jgi:hypothetical protein